MLLAVMSKARRIPSYLRLLPDPGMPHLEPGAPLAYVNRRGETYYLHEGKTKTGKPRYFVAKSLGSGVLTEMPPGFEFTESINGVVSVQRAASTVLRIPDADFAIVRAELSRHKRLRRHRAEVRRGQIVVYEPLGGIDDLGIAHLAVMSGLTTAEVELRLASRQARVRYEPVIKFVPDGDGRSGYVAYRVSQPGESGWWRMSSGRLNELVRSYVRHLGTDAFFELF